MNDDCETEVILRVSPKSSGFIRGLRWIYVLFSFPSEIHQPFYELFNYAIVLRNILFSPKQLSCHRNI